MNLLPNDTSSSLWQKILGVIVTLIGAVVVWLKLRTASVSTLGRAMQRMDKMEERLDGTIEKWLTATKEAADTKEKLDIVTHRTTEQDHLIATNQADIIALTKLLAEKTAEIKFLREELRREGIEVTKLNIPPGRKLSASVLIVDDDPHCRKPLSRILMLVGCAVATASNIKDALASLDATRFDAVLLDVMLPDGNGGEVLQYIRDHNLTSRVAVVSGCEDDRLAGMMELRPDIVFPKPVDVEDLTSWIAQRPTRTDSNPSELSVA